MVDKKLYRLGLAFLAAVSIAATASAGEAFQVCLKFRPGETRRYSLEQSLILTIQPPGRASTRIRSEIKAFLRQQVLAVAADGGAELSCRMESWLRRNWRGEASVTADPAERQTVLNTTLRLRVSPQGAVRVLEPANLPHGVDLDAYGDYGFLPPGPVAVGKEWSRSTVAIHQGVQANISATSRLAKIKTTGGDRQAEIAQDIVIELPEFIVPHTETAAHFSAGGSFYGAGAITFDLAAGVVREQVYYFQGKFLAKMRTGEARAEVPVLMELTTIVSLLT